PTAGREVLNAVFLYECTKAGLDYAIVNSERLERYASIPEEERRLAEDLIYWRGADPVAAFAAHFRGRTRAAKDTGVPLPLDQRLARYVVEGSKEGLLDDLALKLEEASALDILNGPLMKGMEEVGRLFNDNQLIVAEVLQSAEAMKASVAYLEQFMAKDENASRGTIVLATVKGDVHDIGKNLVEIILKNNGYRIVNLGIKVPPEDLIAAYHSHKPDAIGLSGLLVKSAQQMVITAQDLRAAGVEIPLFVGGAALTRKFTATRIASEYGGLTLYAKDAMDGLDLANRLFSATTREALVERLRAEQAALRAGADAVEAPAAAAAAGAPTRSAVSRAVPVPTPPDLELHLLRNVPLTHVFPYLNLQMLLGRHLGVKGSVARLLEQGDAKAAEISAVVAELEREAIQQGLIRANGLYRFYEAAAAGDDLLLFDGGAEVARFRFPRQAAGERLCLADYVREQGSGEKDYVALFAVTCGAGVRDLAERWKEEGQYLRSHALQALAIETAEAF
ncbi:MAG TPA: B12-binding domain-containing protein, partial [Methylomirabilota bacterium]